MMYYSTNDKNHKVDFRTAVANGLAPDGGLYLPEVIPILEHEFFSKIEERSLKEISFEVASRLIGDNLTRQELKKIVDKSVTFDAPVVEVEKNVFALELFHGPTMAFKDFGARFMSQVLAHFAKKSGANTVIVVATSGDTGGAVAQGFLGVANTKVFVLYPSGMVSDIQEKQFATLGKNVFAIEVSGTFDDCQKLVKLAFGDKLLKQEFGLTSANSINIARLIPQCFYYFYAYARLKQYKKQIVFSVPSGNLGNLTAGLIARRMGLPVYHFVAATNQNDVLPEYLQTGRYRPRPSIETISNAMDVGNPSNFARIMDLYGQNIESLSADLTGYGFTDDETMTAIARVFLKTGYLMDPHGAVAYLGLRKFKGRKEGLTGVFLETAHPGKFKSVVEEAISHPVELPSRLMQYVGKEKKSHLIANDYGQLVQKMRQLLS